MKSLYLLITLFFALNSFSQGCNSDVSICTQGVAGPFGFDQNTLGPPTDYADPVGCSTGSFGNDAGFGFILLYITQSGPLNLLVSGDANTGFIDVIIYDIPQGVEPCVAVLDQNNEIGCNYATASVGCTQFGNDFPCNSSVTAPNVVAGQTIMIIAHDYSTSSNSFTLDLGSTGAQTGAPTPSLIITTAAICIEDGNVQLDVSDLGGIWSGTGVSSSGVFNPVTAGVGVHTVTYTIGTAPCNATVSANVEVDVCNIPTCTVSSTVSTPICVGETFDLTASLVPGVLDYAWTGPGGFTSTNQNPSAIPSPLSAGTYNYTVVATIAGATCTSTSSLIVNALPSVSGGNDIQACSGQSVTLSASGASILVWDNNVLNNQAFLPSFGLGTVTFTVVGTNANGCQNSDQINVTVNSLPIVNAGLDQTACQNNSVTLSGSGANTYTWDNGVTNNIGFQIGATTTYTVTGTDLNNCQSTDQVTITVTPADIIFAGNNFAVCENTAITLTASGGQNPIWDNGVNDGFPFTPSSTNTYTVSNTDNNGCTTTDQITVTVNLLPAINAGNDLNVCIGQNATLSAQGGVSYIWNNGVTNGVVFMPLNNLTYTVVGTDVNGCQNSDQVSITMLALPAISAGLDQTVCQNTSVTLSGNGGVSYIWNNGVTNNVSFNILSSNTYTVIGTDANGCQNVDQISCTVLSAPNINGGNDVSICINNTVTLSANGAASYTWNNGITNNTAFTPTITTTYTVTGTDGNGCQNTDDVLVTVNPLPNVNAGSDLSICEGDAVTLSGTGAQNYVWTNGAQNNVSFVPASNQTYTVVGTDFNGCVNTDNLTLSINPIPSVSFIADVTQGCSPLNVLLTNTTPNSTNTIWTINGVEQIISQNLNYSFLGALDCYDISLTTSVNDCANTFSTVDFICVNPTPIAFFDFSEELINEQLSNLIFNNNSQFATQYSWDFGDNSAFSTEENPTHEYFTSLLDEFNISLIATSDFGCVDSLTRTFKVREKLIYYIPNSFTPNGDELNNTFFPIFTSGFEPNSYHLTVFNRWGEVIFESLDYRVGWDGTFKNKMVEEGVYHWKIEFDTKLNQERKVLNGHISLTK